MAWVAWHGGTANKIGRHLASGLAATFVDQPLKLQERIKLPPDHIAACQQAGVPLIGNAAGNSKDFLDLTGQPSPPGPLKIGFDGRGVVALLFSVLCALAGLGTIAWYGFTGDKV